MEDLTYYTDDNYFNYLESQYSYAPLLTAKLDASIADVFTQGKLNEIVLWKLNRYVQMEDSEIARDR